MDEREVHTSLVNIAYSGASTRKHLLKVTVFKTTFLHKPLCPNIRPGGGNTDTHGFNFCINFLSAQGAVSVKDGICS